MLDYEGSKVKAIASVHIGGAFAIHGIKIINTEQGLILLMPQTSYEKDGKKQYCDIFHPITTDAWQELEDQVLDAYEQQLHMEENESQEDSPFMAQQM